MKMRYDKPLRRSIILAAVVPVVTCVSPSQTFTKLHDFAGACDGANPFEGLVLSGNTLYGTTQGHGDWNDIRDVTLRTGTVFAMNTNGTGFRTLHCFPPLTDPDTRVNSDGAKPIGGLVVADNTLYGTTYHGGSWGFGTVFAINTDGSGFRVLRHLNGDSDGLHPWSHLLVSGDTLYGTASGGGSSDAGTIFALKTNGADFRVLHSFGYSDGAAPMAGLVLSGNRLYGTANNGGPNSRAPWSVGTVFSLNTDGTGFTNLHFFSDPVPNSSINADGMNPGNASLALSGNTLYGTTYLGGTSGRGTVFRLSTDGTGFRTLHNFAQTPSHPATGVILAGRTLYGACGDAVFALGTDGTDFMVLHRFTALPPEPAPPVNDDGAWGGGPLVLSGNHLFGTASSGGRLGHGTIFSVSCPPELTISVGGQDVILSWPSTATGFALQRSTNLATWTTIPATPVEINGRNAVTIAPDNASAGPQFYRLSQ
jgi:uncharacterized repeat protein (TIGR03803 family)